MKIMFQITSKDLEYKTFLMFDLLVCVLLNCRGK